MCIRDRYRPLLEPALSNPFQQPHAVLRLLPVCHRVIRLVHLPKQPQHRQNQRRAFPGSAASWPRPTRTAFTLLSIVCTKVIQSSAAGLFNTNVPAVGAVPPISSPPPPAPPSPARRWPSRRGRRGCLLSTSDTDILNWFREQVNKAGGGSYQANINQALRVYMEGQDREWESLLRRVVREELREAQEVQH